MKNKFKCLILILLLATPLSLLAENKCEPLFSNVSPKSQVNESESKSAQADDSTLKNLVKAKNPSKTIRSSAGHFWHITKDIINNTITSTLTKKVQAHLSRLMSVKGWVIGDLHNGNLSPMRLAVTEKDLLGKIDYAVVDYDDPAPQGPLIFDIIHQILAAKAVEVPSNMKISKREIFDAYLRGLKGKTEPIPSQIEKILKMNPEDFRQLEIKKAAKFTTEDGAHLIKDGVRSSEIDKSEFETIHQALASTINDKYEILDIGGREKETGGSAGALRYLVLLKEKATDEQFLFELKEEATSAVTEYQAQPEYSYNDRLNHYVHKNHPIDIRFQSIQFMLNENNVKMTLRPKPMYFFDYANDGSKNSAYQEFKDLTLYNAYWLGRKQIIDDTTNAQALLAIIKDIDIDKVYDAVKALTLELNKFYEDQSRNYRKEMPK